MSASADQEPGTGTPVRTDRFRPSRCGVINLWDYRDEEFVFADGRMVLRGPNGSGKTKALEVLFPFVLDGRIDPRRLNPFAGEERTMKSNLLYRGQESAYAYVWMEFRRGADSGSATTHTASEVVTVGAGLHAQRQNDRVTRWYFVVDGQVGRDFGLLGADDRPLTKRQLAEQIGASSITDRPVEHRNAIDNRLFGLGLERFEQLLTLVLTLRRPQLAKNLDPKGLSQALSDGLRPLDESLILEAAHSFGDMENVQRTLAGLVQADAAARSFLAGYATYLRTHARAACDAISSRLVDVEARRAEFAGALAARHRTAGELNDTRASQSDAAASQQQLQARLDSLKASPAYRDREQLERLSRAIAELGEGAERDERNAAVAAALWQKRTDDVRDAEATHRNAVAAVARVAQELTEAAVDAGIDWTGADNDDDAQFGARAAARVVARRDDVATIRAALDALDRARDRRDQAERVLERTLQRMSEAELRVAAAATAAERARDALTAAVAAWTNLYREIFDRLAVDSDLSTTLADRIGAEVLVLGSPGAAGLPAVFETLVGDHRDARRDELADRRAELAGQRAEITGRRRERAAIASEEDQAPPPFVARSSSRETRAGAPLWAVVDFAPGLADTAAAGVEAALEAANLLDAWVSTTDVGTAVVDGASSGADPLDDIASDAVLLPLPPSARPTGRTLAELLIPEPAAAVPGSVVVALLASIAVVDGRESIGAGGPAPTISTTGRFRQGVQLGVHSKEHAEYIGTTARSRRRAARLAVLDAQIADATARAEHTESAISTVTDLLAGVESARRSLPPFTPLLDALGAVEREASAFSAISGELGNARSDFDQAVAAVGGTQRLLLAAGAARSMPTTVVGTDQIEVATARFDKNAGEFAAARRSAAIRAEQLADARREVESAGQRHEEAAERAAETHTRHLSQVEELSTLRAAVGAGVDQLERDVDRTTHDLSAASTRLQQATKAVEHAIESATEQKTRVDGVVAALRSAATEAQRDSRRLAPYGRPDIRDVLSIPDAVPGWPTAEEQWSDPEAVTESVAEELADDPDAAFEALPTAVGRLHTAILAGTTELHPTESSLKSSRTRVSQSLAELQNQLSAAGHDYRPEWESDDDVIVVKVADEQGFSSIWAFAQQIAAARRDQELLLTESEQRILEDALLGRLAQQIHERTTDARDLISAMNREMRSRRMSSGATVGIGWELADAVGPEQRAVSKLLDREAAQLSTAELARMRSHFAAQIKDHRAARPDRPYAELLSDALDYRKSRTFVLTLVAPDGREDRLTQARHGTLSGGEQSVSLHLPLFAAAHVMLSSAAPHCPRLVALDEAFAGIDDPGRSELLALTAQFDLDLFMTGYDLWATYATVPACAHHDLAHSAVEHTVSALLLVWDGATILTDAQVGGGTGDLAAELGSPGTRRRPEGAAGFDAHTATEDPERTPQDAAE